MVNKNYENSTQVSIFTRKLFLGICKDCLDFAKLILQTFDLSKHFNEKLFIIRISIKRTQV